MNPWPIFWVILDLAGTAWAWYGFYVVFYKVPRLERDLKNARAAILRYITARAERTSIHDPARQDEAHG